KLHPCSGAERPDVLDTTAKLREQGLCACERRCFAARKPDQRPRPRGGYRAADGALDEAGIAGRHRRGDPRVSARAYGAHFDEQTPLHGAGQDAVDTEVYALDGCVVEKEGNHYFRIVHELAERRGPSRSCLTCLLRV